MNLRALSLSPKPLKRTLTGGDIISGVMTLDRITMNRQTDPPTNIETAKAINRTETKDRTNPGDNGWKRGTAALGGKVTSGKALVKCCTTFVVPGSRVKMSDRIFRIKDLFPTIRDDRWVLSILTQVGGDALGIMLIFPEGVMPTVSSLLNKMRLVGDSVMEVCLVKGRSMDLNPQFCASNS